jgi:hypothetical protein
MNIVTAIFQESMFSLYNSLTDILTKILSQFTGESIPALSEWISANLPNINTFFFQQIKKNTLKTIDSDLLRYFFSLQ